jgi:RNA polymerase sigma-70 factor (ECF subfamily)
MNLSSIEESGIAHEHARVMSDDTLISSAKAGDHIAFDQLCLRHSQKIKLQIHRITKNWQDAEDVLQDSCLKAFLHLRSFEGRSSFSSWLTRIAINTALMHLRKRRGREVPLDHASDELPIWTWRPWGYAETPEKQYSRLEAEKLLKTAILGLPPRLREVVEMRHTHEGPIREIANALGISLAAAKTRLLRARRTVRASLKPMREPYQRVQR